MENELITLASYDNSFTANLYKTKLEAAGITCYLMDEHSTVLTPFLSNAIGGIKLRVFLEDAERALQVLDEDDLPEGDSEA
ncbi:DUF2007 domain-containing protein [Compostibacter hankyongensis]|uniref:DUF2007 domain-containing protein n=1 Tax=Compostibacter hankyongensis TaxID=1007089 RepID=A0ABP8FBJ0_9BACT